MREFCSTVTGVDYHRHLQLHCSYLCVYNQLSSLHCLPLHKLIKYFSEHYLIIEWAPNKSGTFSTACSRWHVPQWRCSPSASQHCSPYSLCSSLLDYLALLDCLALLDRPACTSTHPTHEGSLHRRSNDVPECIVSSATRLMTNRAFAQRTSFS